MNNAVVTMRARCTTCGRNYDHTPQMQKDAREFGCAISPCCQAVAVITRVSVNQSKRAQR